MKSHKIVLRLQNGELALHEPLGISYSCPVQAAQEAAAAAEIYQNVYGVTVFGCVE